MIANRVRVFRLLGAPLLAVALAAGSSMPSLAAQDFYTQANLVSDVPGLGTTTAASRFIFATESGTIAGWSPTVDATNAIVAVPSNGNAVYKGLAIGTSGGATFLYATNF